MFNSLVKTIAAAIIALSIPFSASAFHNSVNIIHIDGIVTSICGPQQVNFTGTASYDFGPHNLIVDLDGTPILSSFSERSVWSTGLIDVSVGDHVLTARIHDGDVSQTVFTALPFTITACQSENIDNGSDDKDSNDSDSDGHPGREGDCCPGPDPFDKEPKSTPTIKGARSTSNLTWNRLQPLNSIFRTVFDRTPVFTEWQYWSNRLLTDKSRHDALIGAMQWHRLMGQSIGN